MNNYCFYIFIIKKTLSTIHFYKNKKKKVELSFTIIDILLLFMGKNTEKPI